ncbi:MAG: dual specificity protein phosphatase family protein [Chloroflexi bacterium]|nr:dual specificity protein phosphatase family protein [Chloroflexota bacterium]
MDQIRSWLYIGNYRDTCNLPSLQDRHIGAMLQLAELVEQPDIEVLYLPVEDGEPLLIDLLIQGIEFVCSQKALGNIVLVACGAGISRSSSFALAVLKEEENLNLMDALREIAKHHSDTQPHPALWASLCAYYGEEIDYLDVLDLLDEIKRL